MTDQQTPEPGQGPTTPLPAVPTKTSRWRGRKTAVAAAMAIGLGSAGAAAAAASTLDGGTSVGSEDGGADPSDAPTSQDESTGESGEERPGEGEERRGGPGGHHPRGEQAEGSEDGTTATEDCPGDSADEDSMEATSV